MESPSSRKTKVSGTVSGLKHENRFLTVLFSLIRNGLDGERVRSDSQHTVPTNHRQRHCLAKQHPRCQTDLDQAPSSKPSIRSKERSPSRDSPHKHSSAHPSPGATVATNVRDNGSVSGVTIFKTRFTAPVHRFVRGHVHGSTADVTSRVQRDCIPAG